MNFEKIAVTFGFMALSAALAIGLVCSIQSINSDGKVDYCWVEYNNSSSIHPPAYRVIGHRKWRPDVDVAVTISAEDAASKMQTLCPR